MFKKIGKWLCEHGIHSWDCWSMSSRGEKKYRCLRCCAQAQNFEGTDQ